MALAYLTPVLLLLVAFVYYPITQGITYAFQHVDLVNEAEWSGLENFRKVFADPAFWPAWRNTFGYIALIVLASNVFPLFISLAIHEVRVGRWFFQLASYLPVMMPPIVSALLFSWIFDPNQGLLNSILGVVGIGRQGWLQSPDQAIYSVSIIAVWGGWGFATLIYLSALQQIPPELYEAAEIDGAGIVSRILHVTIPHVRNQILVLLLLGIISAAQMFTLPYVLTSGGPANATVSVVQLVYRYAFEFGDLGAASALGLVLLVFLGAFSALYMALTSRLGKI